MSSPRQAIGLLFVPLFNLYWIFKVTGGGEKALKEIEQIRSEAPPSRPSYGTAYSVCMLCSIIPVVGVLFSLVGVLFLGPLFVSNITRFTDDLAQQS